MTMTLGVDVACRAEHQASLARMAISGGGDESSSPALPTWIGCGRT